MTDRSRILAIAALAVVVIVAAFWHLYLLSGGGNGYAFSRGDETYLFLADSHTGYRMTALEYPFEKMKNAFNGQMESTDDQTCQLVLHITPQAVERVRGCPSPGLAYAMYLTPFEDGIYAMCKGMIVCKWTPSGFVAATDEEEKRVGGVNAMRPGVGTERMVNGWAVERQPRAGEEHEIAVGSQRKIVVKGFAPARRDQPIATYDVVDAGKTERIYDVYAPRFVSRAVYEAAFAKSRD